MRLRRLLIAVLLAAPGGAWGEDYAQNARAVPPAPLHEAVLHLSGDPARPVDLVVTLYTPDGAGPFPLAVVNHGVNGSKERPADMARHRYNLCRVLFPEPRLCRGAADGARLRGVRRRRAAITAAISPHWQWITDATSKASSPR
ncbi:MAG: hypothetical protein WDN04_15400 [Rhodospirillales bacterium]